MNNTIKQRRKLVCLKLIVHVLDQEAKEQLVAERMVAERQYKVMKEASVSVIVLIPMIN